jgi:hypothetical protein
MTHPGRERIGTTIVAAMLLSACYTYQPLARPTPDAGAEVRATFSEPVPFRVGEQTIHDVQRIEGQVYSSNGDTVLVWGTWLQTGVGSRYSAQGGSLALPRERIATLEQRRFSAGRSGLAALVTGGIVAALFALVEGALGGSGNSGEPPNPY